MSIRTVVAAGAIALSAFAAGAASHSTYYNPLAHVCKTEDSNNCHWDGKKNGNGVGESYIVTKDGNVFYFDAKMSAYPTKPFHGIKK